ncbi:MAG: cytochrome [Sphingomonas bacterium]|uniref:cytochrome b n=1 Tax=Sphingomonas bacterium TaxID=1895847 RepID=UPI00262F9591|nr:cytochrome b [Sphingomonas bacterium]MDB5708625.1 cytochrome [Sphingomonas bacterium]
MSIDSEGPAATATRVLAGDDGTNYDGVAIALHWATAALVLVQFALSQTWGWFARPTHHVMVVAHMSFGIILTLVIVVRIIWRLIPGHQIPALVTGWVGVASKAVHYILYALLASEAVLGFTLRWSGGEQMNLFGLAIPSPFEAWSRAANHQVGDLHEKVGWAIILVALGHAAAALYHHYFVRDRVLLRMLPGHGVHS